MTACSRLSYYLVTAVQIDSSFVYHLSILITDDRNGIYRFGIEKACVTTRNYIPCAVVISTTLTLQSVCSVTIVCAIHITAHFMARKAQILIFWQMCSIFFVIKKRVNFGFRFRIFVEVESRDFGGFSTYQTYMLTFRVHTFGSVNY